jgi:hypothetical protein
MFALCVCVYLILLMAIQCFLHSILFWTTFQADFQGHTIFILTYDLHTIRAASHKTIKLCHSALLPHHYNELYNNMYSSKYLGKKS